ncbi:MAG: hypothetical protein JXR63_04565 [Spirochaetales bacterium]|nr:hypothetical protein [Spirochaetales bacterium]
MKYITSPLAVLVDSSFETGKVVIHPNAGFDLGIMTTRHPVLIYANNKIDEFKDNKCFPSNRGEVWLENRCKLDTIEISKDFWAKIGKPKRLVMVYENQRLLLVGK